MAGSENNRIGKKCAMIAGLYTFNVLTVEYYIAYLCIKMHLTSSIENAFAHVHDHFGQ